MASPAAVPRASWSTAFASTRPQPSSDRFALLADQDALEGSPDPRLSCEVDGGGTMARHRRDRTFAVIAGSLLGREGDQAGSEHREAPKHAAGANASGRGGLTSAPSGQPSGAPVPLSGTCSCG